VRRVVTGALELERREKRIGSSLEAAPRIHISDPDLAAAMAGVDLDEIAITSAAKLVTEPAPDAAFRLEEVAGVAVVPQRAEGRKCGRCWMVLPDIGSNRAHPDICGRCADAVGG
ncbi:MAG TPA: isoleucine--tRNA ligase, partial [Alphaproteobacteria bacterium]|nr:isoleucine--tRNA ligase [Alphaproteobacteria bacterium]